MMGANELAARIRIVMLVEVITELWYDIVTVNEFVHGVVGIPEIES